MRKKILVFENRAWEKAEHPRYVSKTLKISGKLEKIFEISYNYVAKKYYVETYETRITENGLRDTYATWRYFDTLEDCFNYIEKTYNVKVKVIE